MEAATGRQGPEADDGRGAVRRIAVIEALSAGLAGDAGADAADAGLLQQGLAMRDAVAADLLQLGGCEVAVAVDPRWAAAAVVPRGAHPVAASRGETAAAFVRRIASAHDAVWVIAPETGGLLAALSAAVPPARWIGCTTAAIEVASSKSSTLARLRDADVTTPAAFAGAARDWVVKPDDGVGAEAMRRHPGIAAACADVADRARSDTGGPAFVEPWIDGDPLSLSLLCQAGGDATLLSVNRQHVDVDTDGRVQVHGVTIDVLRAPDPRHAALAAVARAVVRAIPGLRGYVGIDLVWHAGRGPVVIEVNPRTTSAYVGLSAALGRNLAGEVLAAHCSEHGLGPAPVMLHPSANPSAGTSAARGAR